MGYRPISGSDMSLGQLNDFFVHPIIFKGVMGRGLGFCFRDIMPLPSKAKNFIIKSWRMT